MNRLLVALAVGCPLTAAWASWPRPAPANTAPDVVQPLDPAVAALRSELRAMPLAERCSLTRVLAERVVTAHDWLKDLPVRDGGVGFAVLLPEDVPLLAEGESCGVTVVTRQTNGPLTLTLDPAKIEGPYLFVDWTPELRRAGQPLRFSRSASVGAPQLNISRHARMRSGRTMTFEGEAPELEIEAWRKQDTWVLSMRLSFQKRSVPARLEAEGDGGSRERTGR